PSQLRRSTGDTPSEVVAKVMGAAPVRPMMNSPRRRGVHRACRRARSSVWAEFHRRLRARVTNVLSFVPAQEMATVTRESSCARGSPEGPGRRACQLVDFVSPPAVDALARRVLVRLANVC